jgi:GDP-mannose 6-dehydrogenase
MKIAVVGLGYVGTVSAVALACRGHRVWGVDENPDKVRSVNEGRSPIAEPELEQRVRLALKTKTLTATCDLESALRETDVCLLAVGTPSLPTGDVDSEPLLRVCRSAGAALAKLKRNQIVAIRSSALPAAFAACREVFERVAPHRVELCANPEFLREGSAVRDFEEASFTLIGTDNAAAADALREVYAGLPGEVVMTTPGEALMVKYASNAFHALKVAFANEIGGLCARAEIDGRRVMDIFCEDAKLNLSANYLKPGFAFGGSCLPKDLRALVHMGKQFGIELPLTAAILPSNACVMDRALCKIRATGARRVALVGLSFKATTDDLRESPFVELAERLLNERYDLSIYDPNIALPKLTGTNKAFIERSIPHLSKLLLRSAEGLQNAALIVLGHRYPEVEPYLTPQTARVLDLSEP